MRKLLPYIFSIFTLFVLGIFSPSPADAFSFNFTFPTPSFQFVMPTPPPFVYPTSGLITPTPTQTPLFPTPTPTNIPTPIPTRRLTPTPTKSISPTPTAGASAILDTKEKYILDAINTYRVSQGLSKVNADKYTCDFATIRAKEIVNNFNHDGFSNRASNKTLPYPSFSNATENIAMNSDYTKVVTSWINSAGHAENMRANTPYVCVAYSGNYYAYEGWRP